MKTTLIALTLLSGLALADTVQLTLPGSGTINTTRPVANVDAYGTTANTTVAYVNTGLLPILTQTGYVWGTANGSNPGNDFGVTTDGFHFLGRNGYGGEYVALAYKISDIQTAIGDSSSLNSLTINFNYSGSNVANRQFSIFALNHDSTTTTQLVAPVAIPSVGNYTLTNEQLTAGDTLLFLWGSRSAGSTETISALSLTADYTPAPTPEPTTASLGLLALAGLAARRRRK